MALDNVVMIISGGEAVVPYSPPPKFSSHSAPLHTYDGDRMERVAYDKYHTGDPSPAPNASTNSLIQPRFKKSIFPIHLRLVTLEGKFQ